MDDTPPLDADELMNFSERIDRLPAPDAEWVGALFQECLRARMHEAELLAAAVDSPPSPAGIGELDEQLAQVVLDAAEWLNTLWNVGYMGAGSFPSQPRSAFPVIELEDVLKSALFARIRQGKRPLPFPPPTRHGLPWHELIVGEETMHFVDAEIVRDVDNQPIGAHIEGCTEWRVVETAQPDAAYIVQHRGQGPLFRLQLDGFAASLCREPPRWVRRIRAQDRGGFRSFTLEWPQDGKGVLDIPLRAATWDRAESEAAHWIATQHPEMYGQVRFERVDLV